MFLSSSIMKRHFKGLVTGGGEEHGREERRKETIRKLNAKLISIKLISITEYKVQIIMEVLKMTVLPTERGRGLIFLIEL